MKRPQLVLPVAALFAFTFASAAMNRATLPRTGTPPAGLSSALPVLRLSPVASAIGVIPAWPESSAAFDAMLAVPRPSAGPAPAILSPEDFALRAESLFTAGRLPAGRRAAVAWREEPSVLGVLPSDKELYERMARSPLSNPEREKVTIELFELGGAKPEEIVIQDIDRGQHNILVVKKGRSDRVIVLGGHHDKVSQGAGTIDNWTGATLVTNLYQVFRDLETEATIVFISFGREEDGLVGSARYLKSLSKEQRGKIDAMINLDTLAVNGTFSWGNNSTRALLDRGRAVAAASRHNLTEAELNGGDSDSSTFRWAGIPAMTIFGASQDVIFDIIHSRRDTMAAFNLDHYRNAFLLTIELLTSLDRERIGPVPRSEI